MIRRFARPYAQALVKVAGSLDEARELRDQVRAFRDAMDAVPGIARMAANPAVPMERKRDVIHQIAGRLGVGALGERFLLLLLDNYRLQHLPAVLEALDLEVNRRLGVATAEVTTAQPIADDEAERLRSVLAKLLDRSVELQLSVEPELLAGFRARVGSTLYDASLSGQLDRLAERLAEA
ncbi:MAG: ATP synthase F1 subunit delta [Acidobacteriota bacterium]|jgi:F-type H+-transporting ATPase subunit delta